MSEEQRIGTASPVEVWLRRKPIGAECRVVFEDESDCELPIDSLSTRGAQREVTTQMIAQGYEPVGRWHIEAVDEYEEEPLEAFRWFRLKAGRSTR